MGKPYRTGKWSANRLKRKSRYWNRKTWWTVNGRNRKLQR
jgi:hypothetical protein